MSRDEIKQTIEDYLSLVENGCGSTEENEAKLKLLLDKLALAQHFATYEFDKKKHTEAPRRDYGELRKLVSAQFPNYGHYNLAKDVTNEIGNTEAIVGDAIDDIVDIAKDLTEVKWRWDNNSPDDALWSFRQDFQFHWNEHLRELQIYLLNLERGT